MERDRVILVDGCLRGASLVFCAVSVGALITGPHVALGLMTLLAAIVAISVSWCIPRVFKDLDLPD